MKAMSDYILTEKMGKVLRITLNRPDKLNAWNAEMRDMLIAAFEAADKDHFVPHNCTTMVGNTAGRFGTSE